MRDFMIGFGGFFTNFLGLFLYRYSGYTCTECSGKGNREIYSFTEGTTASFPCDICAGQGEMYVRYRVWSKALILVGAVLALVLVAALILAGWWAL